MSTLYLLFDLKNVFFSWEFLKLDIIYSHNLKLLLLLRIFHFTPNTFAKLFDLFPFVSLLSLNCPASFSSLLFSLKAVVDLLHSFNDFGSFLHLFPLFDMRSHHGKHTI